MIHLERTSLISEGGDTSQFSYQVHCIDTEDKLSQLISLEQQLELTEKRFKNLQNYVEYIRNLYHGSIQDPTTIQVCSLSVIPQNEKLNTESFLSVKDNGAGGDSSKKKNAKKNRRKSYSKKSPSRKHQMVLSPQNESRSSRMSPSRKSSRRSHIDESISRKSSRKTLHDEPIQVHQSKSRKVNKMYYDEEPIRYKSNKKSDYFDESNRNVSSKRILSDDGSSRKLSPKVKLHENNRKHRKKAANENLSHKTLPSRTDSLNSKADINEKTYKEVLVKPVTKKIIDDYELSPRESYIREIDANNRSVSSIKSLKKEESEITSSEHSYLKHTLSSQMKRIRPPKTKFNFRSIPFVAGKALSKSHNLGVKIQETLSIIKRNNPTEVGKFIGEKVTPKSIQSTSNSISRYGTRSRDYQNRSRYRSRSTTITSKPVTAKSSSTLSIDSRYSYVEDLGDNAEINACLKKALIYMQSDFKETLEEYKILSEENNPSKNMEKIKELEYKLDRKEEVIKAFSKLYSQITELRKRLEQYRFHLNKKRCTSGTRDGIRHPVVKMTRLLRKIQDFQQETGYLRY